MERIRKGTFETNSSSVHTLVMPKPAGELHINQQLIDKNGVITVECGDFGDSGVVCGQYEKLQYLCTWIALLNDRCPYGCSCEDFTSEDCYDLQRCVLEPIQEVDPSVKDIKVTAVDKAEFDHQTAPYNSSCVVDIYNSQAVQNFIFNDEIKILMSRD